MNCRRAALVLRGLARNELDVESEEIDELLALGLALEADPDDLAMATWLQGVVQAHAQTSIGDPNATAALASTLRETEERLKSDWFRIKSSKVEIAQKEADRVAMRRAIALLNDATTMVPIAKIVSEAQSLAPGARYCACERLGSERYALTHKGWRVRGQLEARLERFAEAPLRSFLRTFDKAEAKMLAFSKDIAALSANVWVRKNREHIVIGLAKVDGPREQTIDAYKSALQATKEADLAVVCVRNAAMSGGIREAQKRLEQAQAALARVGYPRTPIVMGAAKSILGFALEPGVLRFVEIHRRLEQAFGRGQEILFKFTSRLMPATGTPADIVGRVVTAASSLVYQSPAGERAHARDVRSAAVALASMVKTQDAIPPIVARFRQIEAELVRAGISVMHNVEADALECVRCPGTPQEVVATVSAILTQLAAGRQSERADVAIAVAFAKRFAY